MIIPVAELAVVYIGLALLMALLGRRRKLGPWGYFFSSILLTPIIGLLLVLASDQRTRQQDPNDMRIAELERQLERLKGRSARVSASDL